MCIFKYVEIGEGRNSTMSSEMKTIWIVGAKGRVGKALMRLLDERQYKLFETDIDDVDITDQESVNSYMRITRPDVVINCAGLTDVKRCEMYPDEAYHVNALGARNLAIEVDAYEAKLIQLSTDDVFGSGLTAVWSEFDHTAPRSVYGKSKYAGEQLVSSLCRKYTIIRSSWVYGIGKDYVSRVLDAAEKGGELRVSASEISSPTSAAELARAIRVFIERDLYGIYHVTGTGRCTRFEFAKTILEYAGKSDRLTLLSREAAEDLRPMYSVLNNMMLRLDHVYEPKHWKEALREYFDELEGAER